MFFQGQTLFWPYLRNGWSDWCETKRKWVNMILGPLYDIAFDHTHDLDLGVSRSESEIALSEEWSGRLTWNENDLSHPFMTMILTNVTMVGWADVPDIDRADFRCRRAVDISSFGSAIAQPLGYFYPWCRGLTTCLLYASPFFWKSSFKLQYV